MKSSVSTEIQKSHELKGLKIFNDPRIVKTMKEVKSYWIGANNPSDEMLECLEWAFEEVMFAAVVWSSNQDPLYPEVITITRLPHVLGNIRIPGSRWGIDNPDSVYRVIPISGEEQYLIHGKVHDVRLTENYFTLWDRDMKTVDLLNGKDLELTDNGAFTITVDTSPSEGRTNHIQSSADSHQFYIRDVVLDWNNERPNELFIERIGPPPSRPPFTADEQITLTSEYMWRWVKDTDRWNALPADEATNHLAFTIDRDTDGALRNQIYILGKFNIQDSQALIVNLGMGGADYFVAPLSNPWGTTYDIENHTASLNKHQSVPNDDGTYTYVLSVVDPGVHNWLNPCGYHEGVITLRWAEFKNETPDESLFVNTKLVSLNELSNHIPDNTKLVTPQQRLGQEKSRTQSYAWRLQEN